MLNTNLHNLNVKEKQTVDQFIKMCRDTAKSEELNEQMLKVNKKKQKIFVFCLFNFCNTSRSFIITLKKNHLKYQLMMVMISC